MRRPALGSILGLVVVAGLSTLLASLAGCGSPSASTPASSAEPDATAPERAASAPGTARVGGDVVATVNGIPITTAEVEQLARDARITSLLALRRLEDELVLGELAARAARGDDPEAERAARRASVRAFLRLEVEATHTPETITHAEIEARRAQIGRALVQPELRRASHLLVPLARDAEEAQVDAALRIARELRDEVARADDPSRALDAYAGRRGAFELRVEHLPAMSHDELEEPFADALFAAPALGVLSAPVRTSFGVHVVVLEEILPASSVPESEWEPAIRRQLTAERRVAALDEWAARLADRTPVQILPAAVSIAERAPLGGDGPLGQAPPAGASP